MNQDLSASRARWADVPPRPIQLGVKKNGQLTPLK